GFAGFDFDDILYLFPLIVWFDWHFLFLAGASVGAPTFALLTWTRWKAVAPDRPDRQKPSEVPGRNG
ncbi:MAG: hypothetical protein R3318_01870, partial [Gammaproteobacteria bacterium]|nr:hypothetical protein [Gammaproteobacteria bacterium]